MARCPYEKIQDLEPAFVIIKSWDKIKESKPGIYYLKTQGFLHFHISQIDGEEKIWADCFDESNWGKIIPVPTKITASFIKKFIVEVKKRYKNTLELI